MKQFKYFADITEQELLENVVIPCTNQDGMQCIFIKNNEEKTVSNNSNTDNLSIQMNSLLNKDGRDYYFHIITSKLNDSFYKEQFKVIFDYLFKKIEKPISDFELTIFVVFLYWSPESS